MQTASVPSFIVKIENAITLDIAPTNAEVNEQGYTYDQAGFTYDQAGVMYGGIYLENEDISPVFFNDIATLPNPSISSIVDLYTPPNYYQSIGPGFFMYITQLNGV